MTGKNKQNTNTEYLNLVASIAPKTNEAKTLFHAFWVGGLICFIGQFVRYMLMFWFDLYGDVLAGATSIVMIFLGAFLTGLGVYDRIGKYAGGGSIVPITGFANSVVSPAMEFKSEGYIYGLAAKMFVVAGPIIVFGVIGSVATGLIYYILGLFGLTF
ncbi:MAG: SpoVA/SpoVAEb family sporulation membrane protein [Clostridia bacterium]|nr:SpoVA/SpoVAEb family sporulation membrane protein [Clostridia bacterium]